MNEMENLTVTDLMVGDWVKWLRKPCQVDISLLNTEFDYRDNSKNIEPIPLTPEILEKNGFAIIGDRIDHECDSFTNLFEIADNIVLGDADGCYVVCYERWNGDWDCYDHFPVIEITSVHELQHVLKSLKNGKDIVL